MRQICYSRIRLLSTVAVALTLLVIATTSLDTYRVSADSNETPASSPNAVAQSSISAGYSHTCARLSTGAVKCWGWNGYGLIGDGTFINKFIPTQVLGLEDGVISIIAGGSNTCALTNTGAMKCWGSNYRGQLGNGTIVDSKIPTQVISLESGVTAITAGSETICAVTSTGAAKCWGLHWYGSLGNSFPHTGSQSSPGDVTSLSSGVIAISASTNGYHACALLNTGAMKCWGYNAVGQVGDGSGLDYTNEPKQVAGLETGVIAISTGGHSTCALLNTGAVKCWGDNDSGQLGDNTQTRRNTPTQVSGLVSGVTAITEGSDHTCALLDTGGVKCWGANTHGQLGDNTQIKRKIPTQVTGLETGVIAIAAGAQYTCALLGTGAMKCWGYNARGQLGDGTAIYKPTPTQVLGLEGGVGPTTTTTTTTTTLAPTTTSTTTTTTVPTTTSTSSTTTSSTSVPTSVTTTTSTTTSSSSVPSSATTTTTTPQSQNAIPTIAPSAPVAEPAPMAALSPSTTTTAPISVVVPSPTTTSTASPSSSSATTTTTTIESNTDEIMRGDTKSIASAMANSPSNKIIVFVDGEKTDALITSTDRKVTVSVAGANIVLSATAPDGSTINVDSDGVLEVQPGSTVSTASTGFAAYTPVETWCYCTPTQLGSETTNGIGATQAAYPLPTAVTTGSHHLVVEGANTQKQSITIGFAMRVTNTSVFSRIISNPLAWFFLVIFSLIGLLLPARIRRRSESTT